MISLRSSQCSGNSLAGRGVKKVGFGWFGTQAQRFAASDLEAFLCDN
jgi:hypothetical protein